MMRKGQPTVVQPGKGIFLSDDLCSKDKVWPPTLISASPGPEEL